MADPADSTVEPKSDRPRTYRHHTLKANNFRVETPGSLNHASYRKFEESVTPPSASPAKPQRSPKS